MPNSSFRKALKSHHVLAIAMGGTISSSYFLGNGYVLSQVGPMAFTLFFLGGLITYLTMECFAELVSSESIPKHPSFVGYAQKFISSTWACGVGWAYWLNWVIYICVECIAAGILIHAFLPEISIYIWSMICACFVMVINLGHVRIFGTASFWLTFTHLTLFIGFSVLALLIFFGWIGNTHEFIGTRYFLADGIFPKGISVLFINMVIMMLNYQGTEVIGLSSSETIQAKREVPKAMRRISLTVTALYVIPILLLALIFPWQKATLAESVFALALDSYGFSVVAKMFTLFIIAGSLSCANSGFYAGVRSIHALAELDLSPKWFSKLNRYGIPYRVVGVTITCLFLLLQVGYFRPFHEVYITYLILVGCIGTAIWASICVCQAIFRRHLSAAQIKSLPYKIPLFPYLTYFAISSQVLFLLFALFSSDLRASFYVMIPAFAVPMIWYKMSARS